MTEKRIRRDGRDADDAVLYVSYAISRAQLQRAPRDTVRGGVDHLKRGLQRAADEYVLDLDCCEVKLTRDDQEEWVRLRLDAIPRWAPDNEAHPDHHLFAEDYVVVLPDGVLEVWTHEAGEPKCLSFRPTGWYTPIGERYVQVWVTGRYSPNEGSVPLLRERHLS